jgi:hypothetical protein
MGFIEYKFKNESNKLTTFVLSIDNNKNIAC